MAGIYITLALLTALVFSLIQNVFIKLKRVDTFTVEIHFVYFSITFKKKQKTLNFGKKSRAERKPTEFYTSLVKRISNLLSESRVDIEDLTLPKNLPFITSELDSTFLAVPIVYTLTSYIFTKAKSVTVKNPNFPFYTRDTSLSFDIVIKVPLIYLIVFFVGMRYDLMKAKRKKRALYVGE